MAAVNLRKEDAMTRSKKHGKPCATWMDYALALSAVAGGIYVGLEGFRQSGEKIGGGDYIGGVGILAIAAIFMYALQIASSEVDDAALERRALFSLWAISGL